MHVMGDVFNQAFAFISGLRGQYSGLVALWFLVGLPGYLLIMVFSGWVGAWRDRYSYNKTTRDFTMQAVRYKKLEEKSEGWQREHYRQERLQSEKVLERRAARRRKAGPRS
jgi:hypothetical protein